MNSKKIHVWTLIIFILNIFYGACQASEDLDYGDHYQYSDPIVHCPLIIAIKNRNLSEVEKILKSDNFSTQRDEFGCSILTFALDLAVNQNFSEGVDLLLDFEADPNPSCQTITSSVTVPLITVIDNLRGFSDEDRLIMVRKLIKAKVNLNFQTLSERTALHVATQNGFLAMTKVLLLAGADPNIKRFRKTALHLVLKDSQESLEKRLNFIKILLTAGADPNIEDEDILVKLGIDHTLYKPNLTYKIRQVAYQRYIHGDSSILRTMLGLHRKAMLGTTSEKEGACNRITAQNRDFFKDVVDRSLAKEIRFYMDCDEADSSIKESEAISRNKLYLYFDQDKARLSIEQSEATLRAELTKNMLQ